jgi:hypothetical protein
MNSLLRSGRCDSRRATCKASTASKTTNALIHHSCEVDALCCVAKTSIGDHERVVGRPASRRPLLERRLIACGRGRLPVGAVRDDRLEIVSAGIWVVQISEALPVESALTGPAGCSCYRDSWKVPRFPVACQVVGPHGGLRGLRKRCGRRLRHHRSPLSLRLGPGATRSERSGRRRELLTREYSVGFRSVRPHASRTTGWGTAPDERRLLKPAPYTDDSPRRSRAASWSRSVETSSSTLPRRMASYTASQ